MKKLFFITLLLVSTSLSFTACNDDELESKAPSTVKAVDLGLSVKWASCNVGANSPEEKGDYFAWGETKPQEGNLYRKETYKWGDYERGWLKYNEDDLVTTLESKDDAATVNFGKKWRMPTEDEAQELIEKCKWSVTCYNGVTGFLVTGTNGNSIFLPCAGRLKNGKYNEQPGVYAGYWTSSICIDREYQNSIYEDQGCVLSGSSKYSNKLELEGDERYMGQSIRPVRP